MATEPIAGNGVDATSARDDPPAAGNQQGSPPSWVFWTPIIAAGVGGFMLGSLFFMAAYVAQETAYRITFGITAGACQVLPPLLVWLIMRWMRSMLDEEPLKEKLEP